MMSVSRIKLHQHAIYGAAFNNHLLYNFQTIRHKILRRFDWERWNGQFW